MNIEYNIYSYNYNCTYSNIKYSYTCVNNILKTYFLKIISIKSYYINRDDNK